MKFRIVAVLIIFILTSCASSIDSVTGGKEYGESRTFNTTFENAWIYTKKIFLESGVKIVKLNRGKGEIFGSNPLNLGSSSGWGSYIGVWISEVSDSIVNITVYTKRVLAIQISSGFSESDFFDKFKIYVETE